MTKVFFAFLLLSIDYDFLYSQTIDTQNIEIIRDEWGIPDIFVKTDAEAAYGQLVLNKEELLKSTSKVYHPE